MDFGKLFFLAPFTKSFGLIFRLKNQEQCITMEIQGETADRKFNTILFEKKLFLRNSKVQEKSVYADVTSYTNPIRQVFCCWKLNKMLRFVVVSMLSWLNVCTKAFKARAGEAQLEPCQWLHENMLPLCCFRLGGAWNCTKHHSEKLLWFLE